MKNMRKIVATGIALLIMAVPCTAIYASGEGSEGTVSGAQAENAVPDITEDALPEAEVDIGDPSSDAPDEGIVRYVFEGEENTVSEDSNATLISTDDIEFVDGGITEEKRGLSFDFMDPFDLATASVDPPSMDDGTWSDYGLYYDYNYDVSSAAQWGAWGGNAHLSGQKYPDTNNNDISHAFGLYTDGENVKLYISYAGMFNGMGNGNDYNFMFNGSGYNGPESAKFRVVLDDGTDLSQAHLSPGTYDLKIYHGDHSISGHVADAYGSIIVKPDNAYNEMEVVIPISAMKEQNNGINTDVIQSIAFTTPNLMRGQVSCAGTPTGSGLGVLLAFLMSGIGACVGAGKFCFPTV